MNYIISLDFSQDLPYYACGNADGSWIESYSPLKATRFTSEEEAKNWAEQNTTMGKYAKIVKYDEAKESFDKWVAGDMVRRRFAPINRSLSRKYDPSKDDKLAVLQWRIATRGNENILAEDYMTWPDLFSVFECLWEVCAYSYDDPPRMTFQIRVSKKTKFDAFLKELNLVLDKVTYFVDGDMVLPIFDHFLSEGGNCASLVRHPNGLWGVKGPYNLFLDDVSLEECFKYIKKHRYYD